MWILIISVLLFVFICYIGIINLDKYIYRMKKDKKKKNTYTSRRQRMKAYNKEERTKWIGKSY